MTGSRRGAAAGWAATALAAALPWGLAAAAGESGGSGQDWPAFGRDAANAHHSPLAAIDRGNVARLRPAWIFQTGVTGIFQAEPVVVEGVMYVSTTGNHVAALEAKTGRVL